MFWGAFSGLLKRKYACRRRSIQLTALRRTETGLAEAGAHIYFEWRFPTIVKATKLKSTFFISPYVATCPQGREKDQPTSFVQGREKDQPTSFVF